METRKPRKLRLERLEGGTESPPTSLILKKKDFSGIITAEGEPNLRNTSPLQVCPPPPGPVAFQRFSPQQQQQCQQPDYNVSLLGVQMSLQVLNPLPSPRCSPSNRYECYCSSTESAGSEHLGSASESPSTSRRQETTYFPTAVAISTTASVTAAPIANQSRRVRFRPPPTNTTTTAATAPEDCSCKEETKETIDAPVETLPVPTICDPTTTVTSAPTVVGANHISRFHHPAKRKASPSIGVKSNPAGCPTNVIVATATTDNPFVNVARKINVLQRQSTVEEKRTGGSSSGSTKIAQERPGRMSLRPSLMLNALRGVQRSTDETAVSGIGGAGGSGNAILPNGIIKSLTIDASAAPSDNPTRRLTRFSTLLRAPSEIVSDPDPEATSNPAAMEASNDCSTDHKALLMEVLCYCCCCRCNDGVGGRICGRGGNGRSESNCAAGGHRGRVHRDSGSAGGGGSDRRGDYANLIENHRLARLVTLLAVLAILGLVLTYIIKSIVEQQQQQQQNQATTPTPQLFAHSSGQ
ncbi:EGF region [Echinococcus multilocularis]|uniref:EGF region n=1 Tax=Echinococcus multilocularis TaxID=6211 RepID=A0A068YJ39_ECHMU|nr:EGF region [Echinococcus multilocularis]